jgi:hypothetical protein
MCGYCDVAVSQQARGLILAMALLMSPAGVKALEQHEGLELEAYLDAAGDDTREVRMWSETFFGPRKIARLLGKKYYFDGNPCAHGHDGVRYTSKATCFHCGKERAANWKKANPSKVKEGSKRYSFINRNKISETGKKWAKENPDKVAAKTKRYSTSEKGKYQVRSMNKKRKAASKKATPRWLTSEERAQMASAYRMRADIEKSTGQIYHVDHIIPLRGETVCGLHVPWNLRLLDSVENMRKSNRLPIGEYLESMESIS